MNFKEALKILDIEEYGERIFGSNSHGELFHCMDYILLADMFKDDAEWFKGWFKTVIEWAEKNWKRPESVFQHIPKILEEYVPRTTKYPDGLTI